MIPYFFGQRTFNDNDKFFMVYYSCQNVVFFNYERASAASERVHTELRENPEYERPAGRPWGRSSKAHILGTGHPIDKRSSLLNATWT